MDMPLRTTEVTVPLRTTDVTYGKDYWETLDGGAGYKDSLLWADICHALWEVFVVDWASGQDRSAEHRHLDVGCAYGYLIRHMRSRGVESFGVDGSMYALGQAPPDVAPYLTPHDLITGNDTYYGPDGFSLVTCFETMEHIAEEHVANALGTIARAVRPGGLVVLTICVEGQQGWDSDPTHVTIRPRQWWTERLAAAGLESTLGYRESLQRFWLFSQHKGVFVLDGPA